MGEGTCAKYCTGAYLRIVQLILSAHDTKESKVFIIDKSNAGNTVEIKGELRVGNGRKYFILSKYSIAVVARVCKVILKSIFALLAFFVTNDK
jgi:hypothetical protein